MKLQGKSGVPILRRPTAIEVQRAIDFPEEWLPEARIPSKDKSEWDKDHAAFFIARVFPILDMPLDIRRIAIEAYLTKDFEAWSDGSSVVPDSMRYGYTKDWQGIMHDYLFYLHHLDLPDALGHSWSYWEANNAYRRAWLVEGSYGRSILWYFGLTVGSWPVWNGWL